MSINSVQQLVKGLLQNLALPTTPNSNLIAIVTPPAEDDRTDPRCYIWGSYGTEKRQTMPRAQPPPAQLTTGGFKWVIHKLDIWVIFFMSTEDPNADSQFPVVLEEIMFTLRRTQMPIFNLVDTATGRTSDIMMIGEDLSWDYAPVHAIQGLSNVLRCDGRIVATVFEKLQS